MEVSAPAAATDVEQRGDGREHGPQLRETQRVENTRVFEGRLR